MSESLDEDTVYDMTAAIFDHADEISAENAKGAELSLENATSGMTIPFHKGAARYYAEHGITVDTKGGIVRMKENKIKIANTSPEGQAGSENMSTADVDAVMKKYDRESNIRVWTGKYKLAVRGLLVAFSLWCIYVTLFATFLEEIRLTSFLGLIILIGFLTYPAKKEISEKTTCRLAILFL